LTLVDDYQGSDWIAHGILDSIVDAFFPMIRYVDNEVEDIDHLTIDPYAAPNPSQTPVSSPHSSQESVDGIEMSEKISLDSSGGKVWREATPTIQPTMTQRLRQNIRGLSGSRLRVPRFFIYIKLFWVPLSNGNNARPHTDRPHAFNRYEMIKRITDTRKLVTGLSRLLHGKHNVVGRMRKRARLLDFEGVEAYIGDLEGQFLCGFSLPTPLCWSCSSVSMDRLALCDICVTSSTPHRSVVYWSWDVGGSITTAGRFYPEILHRS
jgi:magnesium transporter